MVYDKYGQDEGKCTDSIGDGCAGGGGGSDSDSENQGGCGCCLCSDNRGAHNNQEVGKYIEWNGVSCCRGMRVGEKHARTDVNCTMANENAILN